MTSKTAVFEVMCNALARSIPAYLRPEPVNCGSVVVICSRAKARLEYHDATERGAIAIHVMRITP